MVTLPLAFAGCSKIDKSILKSRYEILIKDFKFDIDGDRRISYKEFLDNYKKTFTGSRESWENYFNSCDINNDGYFGPKDFE